LYQVGSKFDDNAGLGMVSIASDLYTKIYDDYSLATTGEFQDDYKGNITIKKIRPIEQDLIKNTLYFSGLFAMGILPKESDQMVTKVVNMVKKNAMSESEYTKYEDFKKEFKREPSPFEMGLIKSDKKYDYISKDIDWVNRKGGLNLAQGREYVKLLNMMGEVTTSTLLQIKAGKTADQIAKSMRAKL
jgi:arginyl-tRNA synthetase